MRQVHSRLGFRFYAQIFFNDGFLQYKTNDYGSFSSMWRGISTNRSLGIMAYYGERIVDSLFRRKAPYVRVTSKCPRCS